MPDRIYVKIKNWEKYQHYKDRNPPWVKLYNSMLDDPDFNDLNDATRYHAIAIMLLAMAWLRKALEFYAEPLNYNQFNQQTHVNTELGEKARQALDATKGDSLP